MTDCLFCKITNGKIPSTKRYEDNRFYAFDDINPKAKTHILVVPKKHYGPISTLNEDDFVLIGDLIKTAQNVAKNESLSSYRLVFNNGKDAGMEIDHLHLHILGGNKSKHMY